MAKETKLNLLQIFRYFTGMAMFYFAVTVTFTAIQTGEGTSPTQVQAYINFATNLIQLIYLSIPWLGRKLRGLYLPIALVNAIVVPIFSNLIYLADPSEDIWNIIMKSWLILPILMVPIVLIAWQYKFRYVLIIIIFSTYVELFVLIPHFNAVDFDAFLILGGPLIRAFALGTIGLIVNRLVAIQRAQRRELILANIQLGEHSKTLEQLATSNERNRLARELHDTLAHTLSGNAVNLEAIKTMIPLEMIEIREMLEKSLTNTRSGLNETRRALRALRPLRLEKLGLRKAVIDLANEASSRGKFKIVTTIPDTLPDLTPDIEQTIFRITQESLENIVRHSKALNVEFIIEHHNENLMLTITDDGIGFDLSEDDLSQKLGVEGMKERAALVRGEFIILSKIGNGTTIRFTIPVLERASNYENPSL